MSDLEQYRDAIQRTGFPLEFKVARLFEEHGWTAIQSRYYVDDVIGSPREIDLLAYKATPFEDLHIYTAVLVSCKKNQGNTWVFCSKQVSGV